MDRRRRLTPRQRQALGAMARFFRDRGYPPAQRDLAVALQCSLHTAQEILAVLEKKNYVRHDPGVPRSWQLVSPRGNGSGNGRALQVALAIAKRASPQAIQREAG